MSSIIEGPGGANMVACPKCGQYYRPKDLGPVIIRCKKSRLEEVLAPMERIQQTQIDIVKHCGEGHTEEELMRQLEDANGSKFKDDQLMPVAAMVCRFCATALEELRDKDDLVSVTTPDKINGRVGITKFSPEILKKAGVPTDKEDNVTVEN